MEIVLWPQAQNDAHLTEAEAVEFSILYVDYPITKIYPL
jgi:hypothetical protein